MARTESAQEMPGAPLSPATKARPDFAPDRRKTLDNVTWTRPVTGHEVEEKSRQPARFVHITETEAEMLFFNAPLCRNVPLPSSPLLHRAHTECSSTSKLFRISSQQVTYTYLRGATQLTLGLKLTARKWCLADSSSSRRAEEGHSTPRNQHRHRRTQRTLGMATFI